MNVTNDMSIFYPGEWGQFASTTGDADPAADLTGLLVVYLH